MGEHLPAGVTVATRRIGALAYYSHLNVFDYAYGLTDPKVARMVGRRGRRFDLPGDPELAAAWRSRALITSWKTPLRLITSFRKAAAHGRSS